MARAAALAADPRGRDAVRVVAIDRARRGEHDATAVAPCRRERVLKSAHVDVDVALRVDDRWANPSARGKVEDRVRLERAKCLIQGGEVPRVDLRQGELRAVEGASEIPLLRRAIVVGVEGVNPSTAQPSCTRRSTSVLPMKPAAPVTTARRPGFEERVTIRLIPRLRIRRILLKRTGPGGRRGRETGHGYTSGPHETEGIATSCAPLGRSCISESIGELAAAGVNAGAPPSHIFIVGLARTGTSLLRSVLNASPDIGIASGESHYLSSSGRFGGPRWISGPIRRCRRSRHGRRPAPRCGLPLLPGRAGLLGSVRG